MVYNALVRFCIVDHSKGIICLAISSTKINVIIVKSHPHRTHKMTVVILIVTRPLKYICFGHGHDRILTLMLTLASKYILLIYWTF